jgi:outer membrane protein assembly factor BamB
MTAFFLIPARAQGDAKDWPTYNRDVRGWRHNPDETALSRENVPRLVEKWRFPAEGSKEEIGVVHATPVIVGGEVYFGTATDPAFYKLAPDGTLLWSYRNPTRRPPPAPPEDRSGEAAYRLRRFQSSAEGIMTSALVTGDSVFFGDLGGWFYALDRESGKERWKINTRAKGFPGAHALNCFFASPILADGKVIVAGGAMEQVVAAFPGYRGCTGRGFVMALEPATGRIVWKYDLGPQPEKLDPPITIDDSWGKHTFYYGPATSAIWSTPSFDAETGTIYFGTDVNTAPRRPTEDDPRLETRDSCAIVALNAADGTERWLTQISPGDVWTNAMRSYDPKEGRYKDQSIGDTPKIVTIAVEGQPTKVVGAGCKNGGFYVLRADDGRIVAQTPIYTGPPTEQPEVDPRVLALPSCIGGLQTGCATDGTEFFTNGIDALRMGSLEKAAESANPPTSGRVVALGLDLHAERWRHERPKLDSIGGPPPKTVYRNVGDPVASGIAVANGVIYFTTVASGKLVAIDAETGSVLKEIELGPVWSGPSVSRGRIYVGTGNTLFNPTNWETYFPKEFTGSVRCFGQPGEDEVDRLTPREAR